MDDIDILEIDRKIKKIFHNKSKYVIDYRKEKTELLKTLGTVTNKVYIDMINRNIEKLTVKIKNIEDNVDYNFYIMESMQWLEQYKTILKTPLKLSFVGYVKTSTKEKEDIVKKYLEVIRKYADIGFSSIIKTNPNKCDKCITGDIIYTLFDNTLICNSCGDTHYNYTNIYSFKDTERANISSRYTYDRKIHFRDCMNQYQGKQNCTIDQEVYSKLEEVFDNHHLLVADTKNQKDRFVNITKKHIFMFLKDLGFSRHYENINLIHYNLTGKKPDDISHIEDNILADFDELATLYDIKYANKVSRVNFINTHHVLYQLLRKHKHSCKKEDFSILKTMERQTFHDEIMHNLFNCLGWQYENML